MRRLCFARSGVPNLSWGPVKMDATYQARKFFTTPRINPQFASIENAVNSGKHLDSTPEYKSILSQAQVGIFGKVQRLGTETRTVGNVPTSAVPETEDIVRAVWRHTEAESKRLRDNTTDDVLNTTPADGITAAFFDWRQLAVPISINRLEERQNAGEFQMIDLLEAKAQQAMDGIIERFNRAFIQGNGINTATAITTAYTSAITGAVFLEPLALLVGTSPTAGTIGSIAANVLDGGVNWWANQRRAATDTNFASFMKDLSKLRNDCMKGVGGAPDLHLCDQNVFELYEAALRNQNRYTDTRRADIPFDNLVFHGKPVVWDEWMPDFLGATTTQSTTSGSWVMLNSQNIQVKYDSKTNFMTTPFIRPENQDAKVAHILWYGAIGVNNRRKLGLLDGINTTLTS